MVRRLFFAPNRHVTPVPALNGNPRNRLYGLLWRPRHDTEGASLLDFRRASLCGLGTLARTSARAQATERP